MPVLQKKKTAADKVADLVIDRDGEGSWLAILLVTIVILGVGAGLFSWIDDKLSTRSHEKEKQEIVERSNAERDSLIKQIELRDKDIEAREVEASWSRKREAQHLATMAKLQEENDELIELLNSSYPADLLR